MSKIPQNVIPNPSLSLRAGSVRNLTRSVTLNEVKGLISSLG